MDYKGKRDLGTIAVCSALSHFPLHLIAISFVFKKANLIFFVQPVVIMTECVLLDCLFSLNRRDNAKLALVSNIVSSVTALITPFAIAAIAVAQTFLWGIGIFLGFGSVPFPFPEWIKILIGDFTINIK